MGHTQTVGQHAEQLCANLLRQQGLTILAQNFRSRFGEIDIIASDRNELVFVEVRFRKNANYGQPYETVTPRKQEKLIKTAWSYLQTQRGTANKACRFDIMSVTADPQHIEWIKHAFDLNLA
ncbi:MAG: YraN family protein [Gammaproteobacteria bacterium]|nr:YraN family protein [Gammaproteobacteria bacterium]